jgi:Fe-S cluster assembly ATPase SufC
VDEEDLIKRPVNEGFSGGEKKRNEISPPNQTTWKLDIIPMSSCSSLWQ